MKDNEISIVFISATKKDMDAYRAKLPAALKLIEVSAFLQEDWAEGAVNVVRLCRERLDKTDGYVGVFGFRYGWVPMGHDRSITEIEYDHAFKRWRHFKGPPVFLFTAEPGSKAAEDLKALAEAALKEEFEDENLRQVSRDRQRQLRDRLGGTGSFAGSFTDEGDLKSRVIASISNWNKKIFKNAGANTRGALSDIPLASLGGIGRKTQLDKLEEEVLAFSESPLPGLVRVYPMEPKTPVNVRSWHFSVNGTFSRSTVSRSSLRRRRTASMSRRCATPLLWRSRAKGPRLIYSTAWSRRFRHAAPTAIS